MRWDLIPSENWHRENLSDYEFIGTTRRQPEGLQCESEKVMQLQTTPDNLSPTDRLIEIDHENMPGLF